MLLYLPLPDDFERIFGGMDRKAIVAAFIGKARRELGRVLLIEIDRELHGIRDTEEAKHQTTELDFYQSPLREQWQRTEFTKQARELAHQHALAVLEEIGREEIPDIARTSTYDRI
jgi:5-methylcytosine-specific restriction protein B